MWCSRRSLPKCWAVISIRSLLLYICHLVLYVIVQMMRQRSAGDVRDSSSSRSSSRMSGSVRSTSSHASYASSTYSTTTGPGSIHRFSELVTSATAFQLVQNIVNVLQQRVRPIVDDTFNTAKINFINSGAVDIIRHAYHIHGPELMKLIFVVLYVSSTMGLTHCYETKGFFTFI